MGFFTSAEYTLREQTESISTFYHPWSRKYSLKKLTEYYRETMLYKLMVLRQMIFFQEIHVYLQVS
jgi:hypothetical protein